MSSSTSNTTTSSPRSRTIRPADRHTWRRTLFDYVLIAVAMAVGAIGWTLFLLPHHIPQGGIVGIASVIYWGTGIPPQLSYFAINALLLVAALKVLGWRFCVKTIFGMIVFTICSSLLQPVTAQISLLADQKFMALIVGAACMGSTVGLGLYAGGSTGGSDVVAAMVHKYRDISLGHIIMGCDLLIIVSSYTVLHSWEMVLYGFVFLAVSAYCVDWVMSSLRGSVQFFIVSEHYETIGRAINTIAQRGCTVLEAHGFYTGQHTPTLFVIARKNESATIFRLIQDIDPNAFIAQSEVIGAYGMGFDKVKVKKNRSEQRELEQLLSK